MKVNKQAVYTILSLLSFRFLLDVGYVIFVGPAYAYQHMGLDFDLLRYVISWVMLFVTIPFFMGRQWKLSRAISFSLFTLGFIPVTSYYALAGIDLRWFLMSAVFWVIVGLVSELKLPSPRIAKPRNLTLIVSVIFFFAIASWAILIMKFGISFRLSFDDVYEVRAENALNSIPFGGYVVPWAAKIALPALVVLGLQLKGVVGKIMLALAFLLEIMFFSATGHKSYLFSVFVMVGLYFISDKQNRIVWIAAGCAGVVAACLLIDVVSGGGYLSAMIIRRVFFVPAMLSNAYYEFFDGNFMRLSHSILAPWIENPLNMSPSMAVGEQFLGFSGLNANNGVVADGYMNFGVIGMLVWAVLVGLAISFFDSVARSVDPKIGFSLGMNAFRVFINSGFLTGMLTHGVLFTVLLVILFPSAIKARAGKKIRLGQAFPSGGNGKWH